MKLREVGEDRLLRKLTAHLPSSGRVLSGLGDDCAVLRFAGRDKLLLLKTDAVVAGIHFQHEAAPAAVGWKAMARPLSDFAAMSGLPEFALVTLIVPLETEVAWLAHVFRGLTKAANRYGVLIVGGETSRTAGALSISVSVAGCAESDRWISRAGGHAGDDLYVTGRLGGSIRGRHLRFCPRIPESRWLTEHFQISAMMDLSDGLGADLPRLARASGVAFAVDEASIPRTRGSTIRQAISDGEDYELLFAIHPQDSARLQKKWSRKFPQLSLTRIGALTRKSRDGEQLLPPGYVHFV